MDNLWKTIENPSINVDDFELAVHSRSDRQAAEHENHNSLHTTYTSHTVVVSIRLQAIATLSTVSTAVKTINS